MTKVISFFGSILFAFASMFPFLFSNFPKTPSGQKVDMTKFEMTWNDEFDGDTLDRTKWDTHDWLKMRKGGYWNKEMVSVHDGNLDIATRYVKDGLDGSPGGYYTGVKEEGNVFRVTMPINPYSLMELVDKVYVCSTQMGFEALMAGKEVHVYGMPFYAGWGLTIDKQKNPRRTNRRTLEEVFYIFYIMYTHWVDVETGKPCTIDKAMDNLLALRSEYVRIRSK